MIIITVKFALYVIQLLILRHKLYHNISHFTKAAVAIHYYLCMYVRIHLLYECILILTSNIQDS